MVSEIQPIPLSYAASRRLAILGLALLAVIFLYSLIAGQNALPLLKIITPPCIFKHLTHIPCLFCGFTRSIITLLQGDVATSVRYHPLGLPVLAGSVGFLMLSFIKPAAAMAVLKATNHKGLLFGMIAVLVAVWIWKLTGNPVFW